VLTSCPHCHQPISVPGPGPRSCPKCRALIFVGEPMRDEENRVLREPEKDPENPQPQQDEESEEFEDVGPAEGAHARGEVPSPERRLRSAAREPLWTPGVPWDNADKIGFTEAIYETTRDLFLSPRRFLTAMVFAPMPSRFIPLYGVIVGTVGAAFNLFWLLWLVRNHRPLLERYVPSALLDYFGQMQTGDILAQVFLSPIAGIVIAAFLLFAFSLLLGARSELHHFYRLSGFSAAFDLFYAIPVVGWAIAFIWRTVLLVMGIRAITNLSLKRSLAVFALYLLLSLIMLAPAGLPGGG